MTTHRPQQQDDELARQAEAAPQGLVAEFWWFLRYNKKWWLVPILVALALVAILVALGSSPASPFIYSIF